MTIEISNTGLIYVGIAVVLWTISAIFWGRWEQRRATKEAPDD